MRPVWDTRVPFTQSLHSSKTFGEPHGPNQLPLRVSSPGEVLFTSQGRGFHAHGCGSLSVYGSHHLDAVDAAGNALPLPSSRVHLRTPGESDSKRNRYPNTKAEVQCQGW